MKRYQKQDFPVDQVRRFLEPGPVLLVSSAHRGQRNIMDGYFFGYSHKNGKLPDNVTDKTFYQSLIFIRPIIVR